MAELPKHGKIFVFTPEVAALAASVAPEVAERIYTVPGLPRDQVYVINLDALALGPVSVSPQDQAEPGRPNVP